MTLGERVIRPDFAKNEEVRELKRQFVILVDKMDKIVMDNYLMGEASGTPEYHDKLERMRTAQKAIDALELAAMFAVKSMTV